MDEFYIDLVANIKMAILVDYGTVAEFSRQKDFDRHTLSKVFNGRSMTVLTFVRLCEALEYNNFKLPSGDNFSNMTLVDYLNVRLNPIERAFISFLVG